MNTSIGTSMNGTVSKWGGNPEDQVDLLGFVFMTGSLMYASALAAFVLVNYSKPKSKHRVVCILFQAYGLVVTCISAAGCHTRSTLLLEIAWYGWVLGVAFWGPLFIGLSIGVFGTTDGQISDHFTTLFESGGVLPAVGGYFTSMTHAAGMTTEARNLLLGK
ncbi:hypothetical protein M3Y99_01624500 [Aphelenchoides fujianensis]|nr:hypothetical protein M3Y99_01624500 [Aphelenchoides fujianensis]